MFRHLAWLPGILAAAALAACSGSDAPDTDAEAIGAAKGADHGSSSAGKHLFDNALPHTNGRSCATCHTESEHTTLLPASAAARLAADPSDRLFDPLDADDPTAATLTYKHVLAGLIRVTLPLPPNVDVIDAAGQVITNAARTVFVWRAVPSIENTALTAPYLSDGRASTLEEQALGALHAHSAITHDPPESKLDSIAEYEKTLFSSPGVKAVFDAVEDGKPAPDPDPAFAPGSNEAAGKALFQTTCAPCHGGPSGDRILNRAARSQVFFQLNPDGTVKLDGNGQPLFLTDHQNDEFLNIGISFGTYLREIPPQLGGIPNTSGLSFPHYRLRFYTSASRTTVKVDLPPPAFDANGQPLPGGPNFAPQLFSVDPGRALITGDPADFEGFDVPQLRGISHTAPYFHDHSKKDLPAVLNLYSRFILPIIPALNLPPVVPSAGPGLPPESLTATQKAQLLAYLMQI
jgi:cytochrome c peroxidase